MPIRTGQKHTNMGQPFVSRACSRTYILISHLAMHFPNYYFPSSTTFSLRLFSYDHHNVMWCCVMVFSSPIQHGDGGLQGHQQPPDLVLRHQLGTVLQQTVHRRQRTGPALQRHLDTNIQDGSILNSQHDREIQGTYLSASMTVSYRGATLADGAGWMTQA